MTDVMMDIETLGNGSNSVIIQIGAVVFNRQTGQTIDTFKTNIDQDSCLIAGMESNRETIAWWNSQSLEARQSVFSDPKVHIEDGLRNLSSFIKNHESDPKKVCLWCHATFDAPIVMNAYKRFDQECPWHYRSVRDLRTIVDLSGIDIYHNKYIRSGVHHDGLDDCLYQIKYMTDALHRLNLVTI